MQLVKKWYKELHPEVRLVQRQDSVESGSGEGIRRDEILDEECS